ncbi:MAG: hypothetical protein KGJ07_09305, partial [Patescibacteria group bacterium]|nr:hypothetical protein [Patescibacteria group bacterium]
WAVYTIQHYLPQDFQVQFGPIFPKLARSENGDENENDSEDYERILAATSQQGVLLKKHGTMIRATTNNFGLATQKLSDGSVYVVNTGVIQVESIAGVAVTSTPITTNPVVRSEETEHGETERTTISSPTGYKISLQNTGVVTATAPNYNLHPILLRSAEQQSRVVGYASEGPGLTISGPDSSNLEFFNTGVITFAATGPGLVLGGNNSYPILSLASYNPITTVSIIVSHTDLATGGSKTILTPSSPTARYTILSIGSDTVGSVAWTGGNSTIYVESTSASYYQFDSTTLAQVASQTFTSGNTSPGIKPIAGASPNQPSAAGESFIFKYSGAPSTVDYTAGSLSVYFVFIQVAA